jgi:hypothetical protein
MKLVGFCALFVVAASAHEQNNEKPNIHVPAQ